jgi:hypothetical protein
VPIYPGFLILTNGQIQQFELRNAAGAPVGPADGQAVRWAVQPAGAGTIDASGLYTAPAAATETLAIVSAAAPGAASETATVQLLPPDKFLVPRVSPAEVMLREREAQRFTALVPGDPANGVRWNIAPDLGAMADDGLYTAPDQHQEDREVQVIATSVVDGLKYGTATVKLQAKPAGWYLTSFLFVYLVAVFSLVFLLISLWPRGDVAAPPSEAGAKTSTAAGATAAGAINQPAAPELVKTRFGPISRDIDLLWLVLITGALGNFAHIGRSFIDFVGNRSLRASWSAWYLLYPFIGATLALIFYLGVRGGFLTTATTGKDVNVFGLTAISGLVGMFTKQATKKLDELFSTLFKTQADDKALKDRLS